MNRTEFALIAFLVAGLPCAAAAAQEAPLQEAAPQRTWGLERGAWEHITGCAFRPDGPGRELHEAGSVLVVECPGSGRGEPLVLVASDEDRERVGDLVESIFGGPNQGSWGTNSPAPFPLTLAEFVGYFEAGRGGPKDPASVERLRGILAGQLQGRFAVVYRSRKMEAR